MYVSAKIAIATVRTVLAIRSGSTCGSTCLPIRRRLPGAERARALDVGTLADALRLRADEPRRARPVDDPDDEDDVRQAAAEERGDDDHQRDVRDHEHVVGDPHEDRVALPAVEPGPEPDRAADQHRDERRREADDQRHARAGDDEREHVGAAVVGARASARSTAARRPAPVFARGSYGSRSGAKIATRTKNDEDGEAEDHRRPAQDGRAQEAEPRRGSMPADVGDRRLLVERGRGQGGDAHASTTRGSSFT